MKRSKQCPKCESRRIGHLAEQLDIDDRIAGSIDDGGVRAPPSRRVVGYSDIKVDTGWLQYGIVQPLVGKLEAYVCTDCGYHETYVTQPRDIEWTKLVGFSWLNPDPQTEGPFR